MLGMFFPAFVHAWQTLVFNCQMDEVSYIKHIIGESAIRDCISKCRRQYLSVFVLIP